MKRIVAIFLVISLLAVGFCGCSRQTENPQGDNTTTTTPSVPDTKGDKLLNVLTGEYSLNKSEGNRPLGVMVPNDGLTRGNQAGIDKADFILESETEGAIPRLLALFGNAASVPEKFGPTRSARSPFVRMARGIDAIYCHAGGSPVALETLKSDDITNINALADAKTFWRDSELKAVMDTVHSVATSGEKLVARIQKSGYTTTASKQPFTFGKVTGTQAAQNVQLRTTASHTISFVYDSATKTYGKQIGTLENGKAHTSLAGDQIKVTNIVILYAQKNVESVTTKTTTYDFTTGEGKGYIINNGTMRPIKFSLQEKGFTLTEEDGSPAVFAVGKTYMCLSDQTLASKLVVS